ncbi:hypothetical protein [Aureimonas psammosilenae]|uniref:hypothetical protein n=1 Tax=Aureimonas psammosilenae TaxID=2495496 RepID=UPI0012605BD9|nr:hypothetical protein [Aureimonas psammosilenae]
MDKPDVRALAEDVPAEVRALARKTWDEAPVAECHADVEEMIAGAIMADRRATRETAKAEGRRQGLEEAAAEWRDADEAPEGWHRTYRVGEKGPTWAHCAIFPGDERVWSSPTGHDTVANSGSYAAPTHYLAVAIPPLPDAIRAIAQKAEG